MWWRMFIVCISYAKWIKTNAIEIRINRLQTDFNYSSKRKGLRFGCALLKPKTIIVMIPLLTAFPLSYTSVERISSVDSRALYRYVLRANVYRTRLCSALICFRSSNLQDFAPNCFRLWFAFKFIVTINFHSNIINLLLIHRFVSRLGQHLDLLTLKFKGRQGKF